MSPIKGLSDAPRRLPRLGKFHLGVKIPNKSGVGHHPQAVDYFVVPEELKKLLPDKPTELPIMIPTDDDEIWCPQYFKRYSSTRGLTCRGDGETCHRMIDSATGEMAHRDTKEISWKENAPCLGKDCPHYQAGECKETMNLLFLMPDLPGLGVWQVDTSSINSIRNINNAAALLRATTPTKRVSFIPLLLTIEPLEVINPDDGKKKIVRVLNLRTTGTLRELMLQAGQPVTELLMPLPAEDEAPLDDTIEVEHGNGVARPVSEPEPDIAQAKEDAKLWDDIVHDKTTALSEKHKDSPAPGTTKPAPTQTAAQLDFDPEWLNETLKKIKWTEKTTKDYLKNVLKSPLPRATSSIVEMVAALSREDREDFFKKIGDLAEMA